MITLKDLSKNFLSKSAFLIVDAQPTFMPGGELPVPDGDAIIEPIINILREHGHEFGLIVFSRDYHPRNHCSFSNNPRFEDGSWPPHAIADSANASVHPQLLACCQELGLPYITISKGMNAEAEAYSAFDLAATADNKETDCLDDVLIKHGCTRVLVCGLAGEVCVKATAFDGQASGYDVMLIAAATGWLGERETTLNNLRAHGIKIIEGI
jgi:nicotinamidase/pyrazinamidase